MKKYINKAIRFIVRSGFAWFLIKPFVNCFKNIEVQKKWTLRQKSDRLIKEKILIDPVVRNGFFKGMRYPGFEAAGSAVYPKFIGSYESELNAIVEKIRHNNYDTIIDVGCAEGYYAVGLARLLPESKVLAFDTVESARNLCRSIAVLNNVQDRITISGTLTAEELKRIDFTGKRTLIISDCEGYEKQLFTKGNITNLKNCDVLIETHDLFDLTISPYLVDLFSETHEPPVVIASIDDNKKAQTYTYPETEKLELDLKKMIFAEGRKAIQEWLFFQRKT